MKSKSRCSAVLAGLKGSVIGQVKPDIKKELSCREVSIRYLLNNNPEIGRPRIKAFRGDRHYLMGFTLIELLVVVLIIGILASIALPQYQKAVMKAKIVQLLVRTNALYKSVKVYHLATGVYPSDIRDLDVDIYEAGAEYGTTTAAVQSHTGIIYNSNSEERCAVLEDSLILCSNEDVAVLGHMDVSETFYCRSRKGTNALAEKVCRSMATGPVVVTGSFNDYPIN